MEALLAPLLAAAEAGEDLQPHLAAIREQLVQAAIDQSDAPDQRLSKLAAQLETARQDAAK